MKIGVKTFNEESFLKYFEKDSEFFEVMAIETSDYSFLDNLNKPIVIHAQHAGFGINNAIKSQKNLSSINFAIKIADLCRAEKIILHPGQLDNKGCSRENSVNFIKSIRESRILIENMPPRNSNICTTPEDMKEFLKLTDKKFCLDINHAIEQALAVKIDYLELIREFIKLMPSHYHLGGQSISRNKTHICLKDSDINFKEIINLLPNNAEITLETENKIEKTKEDIEIIKALIS